MNNTQPTLTSRTVKLRNGETRERLTLRCPNGHEVIDTPTTTGTGRRLLAGDYSQEFCTTRCGWEGSR